MDILPGIQATSEALTAERLRLDVIAQNIANAHTTRGPDGQPYARQLVAFESAMERAGSEAGSKPSGVRVTGIVKDPTPGPRIYDPNHPHADAEGMVQMPNVDTTREMVDLIAASRAYEANLSVVRTARQMVQQTLQVGR